MSSPLRALARDYFEGRIDRADYRFKRREIIASFSTGEHSPLADDSARPGETGIFTAVEATLPTADDLVSALAGRGPQGASLEFHEEPATASLDVSDHASDHVHYHKPSDLPEGTSGDLLEQQLRTLTGGDSSSTSGRAGKGPRRVSGYLFVVFLLTSALVAAYYLRPDLILR